ncbi:hypothetical protein Zm00014a_024497 [Zea mays]|uniref:Uncharacterized protein n=1 Tax=Zea mays TaxID=4577 RepID=A0A3L6GB87_MAIZE|nr:hypothetical protein Zm00014a_024497 [Zea mays]
MKRDSVKMKNEGFKNLPLHFAESTTHRPAPATVFGFKLKLNATAMLAEERIQEWGGNVELSQTQETGPSESTVAPDARN